MQSALNTQTEPSRLVPGGGQVPPAPHTRPIRHERSSVHGSPTPESRGPASGWLEPKKSQEQPARRIALAIPRRKES